MAGFTAPQVAQLLRPINPTRVLSDGKGHSHVSQQDVTAHLIRVFGFGSFDTQLLDVRCLFETERTKPDTGELTGRWDVCYAATMRLTVRDPEGNTVCSYEDGSTATAQNQTRGDGHDLAMKSAISLAKKRAAINLGDNFGLSLYNRGQTDALVRGTHVMPSGEHPADGDVQSGVPQQVSLGNDETEPEPERPAREVRRNPIPASERDAATGDPDRERAARLEEAKVRREALGVDSRGRNERGSRPVERGPLSAAADLWATPEGAA